MSAQQRRAFRRHQSLHVLGPLAQQLAFQVERVLGHAIRGVERVYDRHAYSEEKADALLRLARLVETIIDPPEGNVVAAAGRFSGTAALKGKKRTRAQQSEGAASLG